MPVNLPVPVATQTSYGDASFDASARTTDFSFKTVYDSAGRVVSHVEVSVTIAGYVTLGAGDISTDKQMLALRKQLETPGLTFKYYQGVGGFTVVSGTPNQGETRDIDYGPKPTLLRFQPLGAGNAAKIFWSVIVRIPECPETTNFTGLKELCYKVTYQVARGVGRRTIAGHWVIANNLTTAGGVARAADDADSYREKVLKMLPAVPGDYHRLAPMTFALSENRSRVDFSVTDESLANENVPPPGVLMPRFSHAVQIDTLYGVRWDGTFSAEYPTPRGFPQDVTFYFFWRAVLKRLRATFKNQAPLTIKDKDGKPKRLGQLVLLRSFRMEEVDAYAGPVSRFTLAYSFLSTLKAIVGVSQLWTPLEDSDYGKWVAKIEDVWSARGLNGDTFSRESEDVILSLCQPSKPVEGGGGGGGGNETHELTTNRLGSPFAADRDTNPFDYPTAEASWLRFTNDVNVQPIDDTVELKPLPPREIDPSRISNPPQPQPTMPLGRVPGGSTGGGQLGRTAFRPSSFGGGSGADAGVLGLTDSAPEAPAQGTEQIALPSDGYRNVTDLPAPDVEVRAAPTVYVYLTGYGVRAGYDIAAPTLVSYGGRKVVPARDRTCYFRRGVRAAWGGVPVVVASWRQRWLVLGTPSGGGIPGTPLA